MERRLKQLILERGLGPRDALPTGAEPMELFGAGGMAVREALDDSHQDPLATCALHREIAATPRRPTVNARYVPRAPISTASAPACNRHRSGAGRGPRSLTAPASPR
ncbi:hypothetical protein ACH4CE_10005 [Streptomyces gelaticus]|uniref:hypothetical protein n=1 Tax=Streptomyces gelaticus TaxID=285446 RepID=UPI0037B67266